MPLHEVVLVLCLLTPVVVSSLPKDCDEVYNLNNKAPSGVYNIYPVGDTAVKAYCDMDTDGGRWTVFQRRMDGTVGFIRPWDQYKRGFGNADGEYWLGLENIFYLTHKRSELRVDMEDFSRRTVFAQYSNFYIGSEDNGYMLNIDLFTDGGARDGLSVNNGKKFSTLDQDSSGQSCGKRFVGGYWYGDCGYSNPNGVYLWGDYAGTPNTGIPGIGVTWYHWQGPMYSLKSISMKVRPVHRREEQDEQTDE